MKKSTAAQGLYFTADSVPTEAERAEADVLGFTAMRNAKLVDSKKLEKTARVAGCFPEAYLKVEGVQVVRAPQAPKAPKAPPAPPAPPSR